MMHKLGSSVPQVDPREFYFAKGKFCCLSTRVNSSETRIFKKNICPNCNIPILHVYEEDITTQRSNEHKTEIQHHFIKLILCKKFKLKNLHSQNHQIN